MISYVISRKLHFFCCSIWYTWKSKYFRDGMLSSIDAAPIEIYTASLEEKEKDRGRFD